MSKRSTDPIERMRLIREALAKGRLDRKVINSTALAVLDTLVLRAGDCAVGRKTLAAETGMTTKGFDQVIAKLETAGLVRVDRRKSPGSQSFEVNAYTVCVPNLAPGSMDTP